MTAEVLLFMFCFVGENCVKKFVKIQKLDITSNSNTDKKGSVQDKAGELRYPLAYFQGRRFKRWQVLQKAQTLPKLAHFSKIFIDLSCFLWLLGIERWLLISPALFYVAWSPGWHKTVPWIFAGNSEAFDTTVEKKTLKRRRQSLKITACRIWHRRNDDDTITMNINYELEWIELK